MLRKLVLHGVPGEMANRGVWCGGLTARAAVA